MQHPMQRVMQHLMQHLKRLYFNVYTTTVALNYLKIDKKVYKKKFLIKRNYRNFNATSATLGL